MEVPAKSVQHKIREDLKKQFPRQKFSVDVHHGATPHLRIQWINGPSADKVDEVCRKHSSEVPYIAISRKMTNGAKELALSILVENNRRIPLLTKSGKLKIALPKEDLDRLSAGQYVLTSPTTIDDAIIQVFKQMSL